MQSFVRGGGRSGSPQTVQRSNSRRAVVGANARIPMNRPLLDGHGVVQHEQSSRMPSGRQSYPSNAQPLVQRRPPSGQGPKHDPWDTDVESLDTTMNQSAVQVEDDHRNENDQDQSDGEDKEDEEDESESAEEEENFEQGDYHRNTPISNEFDHRIDGISDQDLLDAHDMHLCEPQAQMKFLQRLGRYPEWKEGDSYPTTTSGAPSDIVEQWHQNQRGRPSNRTNDSEAPRPPQHQASTNLPTPATRQLHSRPSTAQEHRNSGQPSQNIFDRAATARVSQRNNAGPQQHAGFHDHAYIAPQSSQPPTYSQATSQPLPESEEYGHQQNDNPQIRRPPQRGAGGRRTGPTPTRTTEPARRPVPNQSMQEPPNVFPCFQETPAEDTNPSPVEDYDDEPLLQMSYNQLKCESFDHDPRASPPILTEDMQQKPLEERLAHVQNLDAGDQARFFHKLPTTEWEETGDWFLDQLSNVIRRVKDARQEKRKLAAEFENEVEKRHQQVAKKQQQVQGAMDKMKSQGEGLMPRSPRGSKSPRPKRAQ